MRIREVGILNVYCFEKLSKKGDSYPANSKRKANLMSMIAVTMIIRSSTYVRNNNIKKSEI